MRVPPNADALRQALLAPRSVAIVGQSNDAGKASGRPLDFLRRAGFGGKVYCVNARRDTVLGERAYPTVAALPEPPEHAYILVPTEAVIDAVAECGRAGVKIATILAAGFSETGADGVAREQKLREIAAETGIRVVGPSSLGVVNLRNGLLLTANAAFAEPDIPVGRTFFASHSGTMIGALMSRGKARGLGFAGLVSIGNEVDLSIGEICAATLDDPEIDGYLLFLESIRNSAALRDFALGAAARGKPVVAYKLGRSAAARELAVTHTGALAGEDDVASAFLADCGIARVESLEALIEALPLVHRTPIRPIGARAPQVAVLTTTAGGATMVVDPLAMRGVEIAPPSAETFARFAAKGIQATPARIVDLTIAGTRYDVMKAALDILTTAPEFDMVLAVVGSSARFHPQQAVQPIIDSANAAKPLAAFLVPEAPEALARLSAAGIPSFRTPEACADAIAAALARREPKPAVAAASGSGGRVLDELEAYALLDRLGVPRAAAVALETAIVPAPALPFGYPVAVKVLSANIAHKTEAGGVALNVPNGEALVGVIKAMRATVKSRTGIAPARVLVAPMISGVGEALIGYRVDREVGPVIMVAAGGVFTEIYRDRSLRLAPVDLPTAHAMISEVKAFAMLRGFRGKPAGNLDALANAIVALSRLALQNDPAIAEAEVNPLIVQANGVVGVDALVREA
ncbi:MAG: acetate--CoA ligase family protein [Alphaproteobacteria bacterium]|nr:MAG: acetate--CoA ligase family protein [Alphaproteobacteria bacterium]